MRVKIQFLSLRYVQFSGKDSNLHRYLCVNVINVNKRNVTKEGNIDK